jgi:hypothetical protein
MMDIKPCPFCLEKPKLVMENNFPYVRCMTELCPIQEQSFSQSAWNTRQQLAKPAVEWMPIETAPKDESIIMLTNSDTGAVWAGYYKRAYQSGYVPPNSWHSFMLNHSYMPKEQQSGSFKPTHWMPLPAAYDALQDK